MTIQTTKLKETKRAGRHMRIRKKLKGSTERPRLCVHRSLKNFYAQLVDDVNGKVLFGLSTLNKQIQGKVKGGGNIKAAEVLGAEMAEKSKSQGISKVCFDRGGYRYHGRIKAFAEGARKGGLEF